jgi:hypothetical protein
VQARARECVRERRRSTGPLWRASAPGGNAEAPASPRRHLPGLERVGVRRRLSAPATEAATRGGVLRLPLAPVGATALVGLPAPKKRPVARFPGRQHPHPLLRADRGSWGVSWRGDATRRRQAQAVRDSAHRPRLPTRPKKNPPTKSKAGVLGVALATASARVRLRSTCRCRAHRHAHSRAPSSPSPAPPRRR